MREIKFRAWDKVEKRIRQLSSMGLSQKHVDYANLFDRDPAKGNTVAIEDMELMQYTGLKDKNGKEIYEGDIVNNGTKDLNERVKAEHYPIRWSESRGCWWVGDTHVPLADGEPDKRYEVIGNIYENPELLK